MASNSGIFEYLMAAAMEKVHSQVLGWIFSLRDPHNLNEKESIGVALLKRILGIENETISIESVVVEYNNFDILIEWKRNGTNCTLIIENKIKSSEHSNQLARYVEDMKVLVEKEDSFQHYSPYQKERHYYFLLQLIHEKNLHEPWRQLNYSSLSNYLRLALEDDQVSITTDVRTMLEQYLDCITRLSDSVDQFILNPAKFGFVFSEGKTRKLVGSKHLHQHQIFSVENYIKANQLETILQKAFYFKLMQEEVLADKEYHIGESHGTAILDLFLPGTVQVQINSTIVSLRKICQFQGAQVKFALAPIPPLLPTENEIKAVLKEYDRQAPEFIAVNLPVDYKKKKVTRPRGKGFSSVIITSQWWQTAASEKSYTSAAGFVSSSYRQAVEFFDQFPQQPILLSTN